MSIHTCTCTKTSFIETKRVILFFFTWIMYFHCISTLCNDEIWVFEYRFCNLPISWSKNKLKHYILRADGQLSYVFSRINVANIDKNTSRLVYGYWYSFQNSIANFPQNRCGVSAPTVLVFTNLSTICNVLAGLSSSRYRICCVTGCGSEMHCYAISHFWNRCMKTWANCCNKKHTSRSPLTQ